MSEQNKNKNIEKEEIEHLNKEQNNQEYEEDNDNQMVEEEEGSFMLDTVCRWDTTLFSSEILLR